ncbi:MAG: Bcr/CflA family drug resistance efflux transporter [Rhodospirillales bacterium]|nr:Bcr/CflA family drug resistance efflux transporter [Rhodospirillales bacterium]
MDRPPTSLAPPRNSLRGVLFTVSLSLMMAAGALSVDMYTPALPAVGRSLGAGEARVLLTLSSFLLGFGIGHLFWGPLGDRWGRRKPIAVGMVLYIAGSVGCALSGTIEQMILWRLVQAFGGAAASALSRAIVRDAYARDEAARAMSLILLVMYVAPMLAPLLGGQILVWLDWPAIFWVLAGFGVLCLAGLAIVPETLPRERRVRLRWYGMVMSYGQLLADKRFVGYALNNGLRGAGLLAYVAGAPFVYIGYFGVAPQYYGFLTAGNIVGMMLGNLVNSRLVVRVGSDRMLAIGTWIGAVAGLMLLVAGATGIGGIVGIAVPLFLFLSLMGLINANSTMGALSLFPERAGAASALMGTLPYALGAVAGAAVGWLADGTPWPMSLVISVTAIGALAANLILVRPIVAARD